MVVREGRDISFSGIATGKLPLLLQQKTKSKDMKMERDSSEEEGTPKEWGEEDKVMGSKYD